LSELCRHNWVVCSIAPLASFSSTTHSFDNTEGNTPFGRAASADSIFAFTNDIWAGFNIDLRLISRLSQSDVIGLSDENKSMDTGFEKSILPMH